MTPRRGIDLTPLKRALDNNDLAALNAYLESLPQRSRNELLRLAGEEFGFETYEVEGVRYMLARELSYRLYGTTSTSALRKLLLRWNRPLVSIRSVGRDGQHTFKRLFKLANRANWTLLATWDHFGIAAMKSDTPMARKAQEYFLNSGVRVAADRIAEQETGHSVSQLDAIVRQLASIEQRLTMPVSHDVAEQQVMALRITNLENLLRAGNIGNIRVGRHNMGLAMEALAGQLAGIPVKTLKARDQHRATGWRTTYPGGNQSMEQELGRFATKFMTRDNLHIEQTLQQRTYLAPIQDVNLYPWHILEEALALLASRGKAVQRLDTGASGLAG